MEPEDRQTHWQSAYAAKGERDVSWFQDSPQPSLALVEEFASSLSSVIDIGGGAARLADALLQRGFQDLTVLDLSASAMATARASMSASAARIHWIVADITTWEPERAYDLWHDRAAFHFLVNEPDRAAYLSRLSRALKPGGHAIIATFAPDGPERCSGLPVARYDADSLARTLGPAFQIVSTRRHVHVTPSNARQAFQFSVFRHRPRLTP